MLWPEAAIGLLRPLGFGIQLNSDDIAVLAELAASDGSGHRRIVGDDLNRRGIRNVHTREQTHSRDGEIFEDGHLSVARSIRIGPAQPDKIRAQ